MGVVEALNHPLVEVVPNATGPPGYRCKECNANYERKQMKLHVRTHTGEKPFTCNYSECGIAFARQTAMNTHRKRTHEKIFNHSCPICERKFFSRSDKLIHIVVHDEARNTRERFLPLSMVKLLSEVQEINFDGQLIVSNCVCDKCGKIFDTPGGKRRHVKSVHSEEQLKVKSEVIKTETDDETFFKSCSKCLSQFSSLLSFKIHCNLTCDVQSGLKEEGIKQEKQLMHEDNSRNDLQCDDELSCDLCDKVLSTKESLAIHKIIHKELNRFLCKENNCIAVFPNQKSLISHLEDTHQKVKSTERIMFYKCEHCDKQCTTERNLDDHMLRHSKEKKFECLECGKRLKRRDTLIDHMKIHSGEKNYQCDQCEGKYTTSAALRNHVVSKHTDNSNAVPFMCSYCGKDFPKKAYLLNHITGHTGEKNHGCEVCPKSFRFKTSLENHMNMHNGVKKYQCPHCEKRFTQSQQRTMHIRRHNGDKRHKCESCDMAFIEPAGLRNHIKTH